MWQDDVTFASKKMDWNVTGIWQQ